MTDLQQLAVGGIMLVVMTTVTVSFISDGLSIYGQTGNVDQGKLDQIANLSDTDINQVSDTAQQQAQGVNPKASFFTLPGLVSTFSIVFEVIPVFEALAATAMQMLGLTKIPVVVRGVFAIIGVIVAFTFARRILG